MVVFLLMSLVITPPERLRCRAKSGVTSKQQHVLDVAFEHAGLDRRADATASSG